MQVAIVTGAAGGIGKAVAARLANAGYALLLVDVRESDLCTARDALDTPGIQVDICVADLTDPQASIRIVQQARESFGRLDALISNAGAVQNAPLLELEVAGFDHMFATNTRPTWLLAKAAHALLKESRGSIVATASIASENAAPPLGAYAASKAALVMLVQQMALEWGSHGIRCNCVSPGPTFTPMTQAAYSDEAIRRGREAAIPLGRLGTADDIARAIFFLASPESGFINGVNLVVDGGLTKNLMLLAGSGNMGRAVQP
jgi:NAD(P)-dependent dehydrogenase (short-subunit alcohol dehydrogenase family)